MIQEQDGTVLIDRNFNRQCVAAAQTVSIRSRVPYEKCLIAAQHIAASGSNINVPRLQRLIGVRYKTAWLVARRIRECLSTNADP